MSLTGSGEEHDEKQQEQRQQSVRLGAAAGGQTPAELAVTTRRSMRGARREGAAAAAGEAYPWLNGGVVGRPRAAVATGDRRQWQKHAGAHKPLVDQNAPSARRRVRTSEPSSGSGFAGASAPAIPRSTSFDMMSQSTLVSAAAKSQQASKRTRSWRRPMGRASSTSMGGVGSGDMDDDDEEEGRGTISFRDAALVAWLNSVLNFENNDHGHGETFRCVSFRCHEKALLGCVAIPPPRPLLFSGERWSRQLQPCLVRGALVFVYAP